MRDAILRIARPTDDLAPLVAQYRDGLGFTELGRFSDRETGFDGVMLGHPQHPYHLEFTHHRGTVVGQAPSPDHLLVFYLPDPDLWDAACARCEAAGWAPVAAFNPYWDAHGRTFEDRDGYRVVLCRKDWATMEATAETTSS
jgi:hypothetical protein